MMRFTMTALCLTVVLSGLSGCGDSKPVAGGNVTMHDMEVVDGTANDSMADLDNATEDGTLLSNTGDVSAEGTHAASAGNSAGADTTKTQTGAPDGNSSVAE